MTCEICREHERTKDDYVPDCKTDEGCRVTPPSYYTRRVIRLRAIWQDYVYLGIGIDAFILKYSVIDEELRLLVIADRLINETRNPRGQ